MVRSRARQTADIGTERELAPCGAFGAGQPWASDARFRDPLDKRGLASGFLRKVWFWGGLIT